MLRRYRAEIVAGLVLMCGILVYDAMASSGRLCTKDSDCSYGEVCMKEKPTSASARCVKGARP